MTFPIYSVVGIPVIFVLGLAGALVPTSIGLFFPNYGITQRLYYSLFNGVAAGLVLAVGTVSNSLVDHFSSHRAAS
jgi:hypothetical protein